MASNEEYGIFLQVPDAYVSVAEYAGAPDQLLQLSGERVALKPNYSLVFTRFFAAGKEPTQFPSDVVALQALSGEDEQTTGFGYLASLFKQFSVGDLLLPEGISRIFSVTPSRTHPFGGMFPDCCAHNTHDGLSLSAWLNLWS